eukprot:jgi/Ulvmu1/1529/UM011_0259.1
MGISHGIPVDKGGSEPPTTTNRCQGTSQVCCVNTHPTKTANSQATPGRVTMLEVEGRPLSLHHGTAITASRVVRLPDRDLNNTGTVHVQAMASQRGARAWATRVLTADVVA